MGGQNSDLHRNWWSKSVQDSHCFCKWRPKIMLLKHTNPQFPKEKRTLPGGPIARRQLWWSQSVQDTHCFCKWRPKVIVQSFRWPQKKRYSELRILISCRHGWPKFWFASKSWWLNSGVDPVVLLHDSHSFCKWRPKSVVQSLRWPQNLPF